MGLKSKLLAGHLWELYTPLVMHFGRNCRSRGFLLEPVKIPGNSQIASAGGGLSPYPSAIRYDSDSRTRLRDLRALQAKP